MKKKFNKILHGIKSTPAFFVATVAVFFTDFFRTAIPFKGDSKREIIRKILFWIFLAVFVVSAVYIIKYYTASAKNTTTVKRARTHFIEETEEIDYDNPQPEQKNPDGSYKNFDYLKSQNPDIKAWLEIPDTSISYPVYQASDNEYYINHNMKRKVSSYGALFFDSGNVITADKVSRNLSVYGHHMKNGSMFARLVKYRSLKFYRAHPTIQLTTLYGQSTYKIIAAYTTNAYPEQDGGNVFDYNGSGCYDEISYNNWLSALKERSVIWPDVDANANDDFLILSTCTYEFTEARFVVVARKTREGEDSGVAVKKAAVNPSPKYPQAWYEPKN